MIANKNRQILFQQYPNGKPDEHTLKIVHGVTPEPGEGELLLRTLYLSVDPYLRNRMNSANNFYLQSFQPGQVIVSSAIGQVVSSKHPSFFVGDLVEGMLEWRDYCLSDGSGLRKLNPDMQPLTHALGILGIPGLTAYFGMLEVGQPKPGESIVVSGASGAVGSAAGQIAKIEGAKVIGIAGSEEKTRYLVNELGFDQALNYKSPLFAEDLKAICPEGPDLYFDNDRWLGE